MESVAEKELKLRPQVPSYFPLKFPFKPLIAISLLIIVGLAYDCYRLIHPAVLHALHALQAKEDLLAAANFFKASKKSEISSEPSRRGIASVELGPKDKPTAQAIAAEPDSGRARIDRSARAAILACSERLSGHFGRQIVSSEFATLQEYLKQVVMLSESGIQREIQSRQVQLLDFEGHRHRLRISKDDTARSTSNVYKVELKNIDDESLPIPESTQDFRPAFRSSDVFSALERFKSQGQVETDRIFDVLRWDNGSKAEIVRENGQVLSLILSAPNGSELACRTIGSEHEDVSCRCL